MGEKCPFCEKAAIPRWCPKRPEIDRLMASQSPFWPLLGTQLGKEAKSSENGRVKPYFGRSEQATTPGFTTHTLCTPGGVHTNYSFLPL